MTTYSKILKANEHWVVEIVRIFRKFCNSLRMIVCVWMLVDDKKRGLSFNMHLYVRVPRGFPLEQGQSGQYLAICICTCDDGKGQLA